MQPDNLDPPNSVDVGAIVGSVLAGISLLAIIIYALWKVRFYKITLALEFEIPQ